MPSPWGNWGGGGSSGTPNTGFWNNFIADPANTPGDYIRYGMGPVDKANYANSGAVPGTIPNAADTTYNDRMASAYAFGQNWPSIAQPVQSMVNGLRDPNSGFNQAQMMPGVTVGSVNPFQDPNSSLIDPAYQAMQQGVNAAGGGLYEGLDAWGQMLKAFAGVTGGAASTAMPNFSDVSSGSSTTSPVSSLMTAAGITPSQSVIDTAQNIGLGNLYNVVAAERANPGSTQLAGTSTADLANLDRLGEFYARAQSDPAYAPLLAAIIPGYELAKGAAQTIPGGQAIWNAGVNAATAISPNPIGIPLNELTMDNTTSPASMTNVTSGLGGLAAGLYDRYRGTVDTGMPNFSDVHGGGSSTGIPSQSSMDVTAPYFTGTPPNSGPQEPFNDAFAGIATSPTFQRDNNMPSGNTNFNTLVPDPNAPASPAPGSIDFGPNSNVAAPYTPPAAVQPNQQFSAGNESNNFALDPALAAMYSNTSGAGTSALQLSEATSHPSYMNYLAWLSQNHPYSGSWLGQ